MIKTAMEQSKILTNEARESGLVEETITIDDEVIPHSLTLLVSGQWAQWSGPHDQISPTSLLPLTAPSLYQAPGSLVSCSARVLHGNELWQLGHGA